jgi:hypothetical protein
VTSLKVMARVAAIAGSVALLSGVNTISEETARRLGLVARLGERDLVRMPETHAAGTACQTCYKHASTHKRALSCGLEGASTPSAR